MPYQSGTGEPNYTALLKIPILDRVPGLAATYGEEKVHALIVVMLTDFVQAFNLARPMSTDQIVTLAYDIMLSTREDFLSLEDLALFFKRARLGTYGKLYEGIDGAKIFEMLEQYRQQRHEVFLAAKYEQEQQFKAMPINNTVADLVISERDLMREATIMYMKNKTA